MRRWLAGLLSVMILFSGSLCLAEDTESMENADIQETVVSVEGESLGTLSENIRFLVSLTGNEEIRGLLKIEDVKSITSEIIWRTLVWLYQNRPVTMKILAELGVKEADLRCIEKLWDSADRIGEALMKHSRSEDGRQLQAEAKAVKNDPELQEALVNFQKLATSEDLKNILDTLDDAVISEAAEHETVNSDTVISDVDQSSFIGKLVVKALSVIEQSEWAQKSVPNLLKNENLRRFLAHLSVGNPELDRAFREEFVLITSDPEMNVFFREILLEVQALFRALAETETDDPETADPEATEKTGKEVTP